MAQVETKVEALTTGLAELKGMIAALQADLRETAAGLRTDQRETAAELRGSIAALRADQRETATELRGSIAAIEGKMDRRFEAVDRRFLWVLGIQFTTLLTIIAWMFGVLRSLL